MKNLRANAIHNVLGWLLPAAVFFALTPVMINHLGVEAFGVIALVQVITGYMNVLNFGFSEAITKQVAEAWGREDRVAAGRAAWVGFGLFAAFGTLGAAIVLGLSHWLAYDLLKVDAALQADTRTALRIGSAVFLLQMLAEFYRGTAMGTQRFDIPNLCRILRIGLSAVFIVLALQLDGGMPGVMWATLAGLAVGLVVNVAWMERVLPLRPKGGDLRPVWREVLHYSKHVFAMRLANIVSSRLAQFFLGALSSAANVALYEVPVRVAETGSALLNRILQVFFPGFAAMDRVTEMDRIRRILLEANSLQLLAITPFFLGMALEGPTLLALWINPDFARQASGIIAVVCVNFWLSSLTNLPSILALALGMPDIVSKYSLIRMGVTLTVGYPLVANFGLMGAAVTLLLSELPALVMIPETLGRALDADAARAVYGRMARHFALAAALYAGYEWLLRPSAWYSPWMLIPAVGAYFGLALAIGLLGAAERRRLHALLLKWR